MSHCKMSSVVKLRHWGGFREQSIIKLYQVFLRLDQRNSLYQRHLEIPSKCHIPALRLSVIQSGFSHMLKGHRAHGKADQKYAGKEKLQEICLPLGNTAMHLESADIIGIILSGKYQIQGFL